MTDAPKDFAPPTPAEVLANAYASVFRLDDPLARTVILDLAEQFHAARSTQGLDVADTAFRNGQRAVFLYIAGRAGLPLLGG